MTKMVNLQSKSDISTIAADYVAKFHECERLKVELFNADNELRKLGNSLATEVYKSDPDCRIVSVDDGDEYVFCIKLSEDESEVKSTTIAKKIKSL